MKIKLYSIVLLLLFSNALAQPSWGVPSVISISSYAVNDYSQEDILQINIQGFADSYCEGYTKNRLIPCTSYIANFKVSNKNEFYQVVDVND